MRSIEFEFCIALQIADMRGRDADALQRDAGALDQIAARFGQKADSRPALCQSCGAVLYLSA